MKAKPTTGRPPQVAEIPDQEETVRGAEDPPVVTLEVGPRLQERRLKSTQDLPGSIIVPTTNLTSVPVTAALQAVLAGTEVSLSWDSSGYENRLVTVTNLSGPLPNVVEKICASAKVFCSYHNGMLEMKEKETFIVALPSVPTLTTSGASTTAAANNTMAEAIGELAGEKAKVDQHGGNLIYTTDVEGQDRVREYLRQLRHGRPLVVLQLYIWEVTLNKDYGTGINWNNFKLPDIGGTAQNLLLSNPGFETASAVATGFGALTSPGATLGAKMSGLIDADSVVQFLSSQGQVQTISNPQLTFISGSNAEFRVGGKQRYISQVGQITTSNVSGEDTTSTGIGTNTVATDSLDTGLTVQVSGAYENGVIFAILELELQDVISLNPTTSQGVTIDLPETSERKVATTLRVRPGDNLVLAGLVTSRDDNNRNGLPLPFGKQLTAFAKDELKNTELVILVKPSVVLFAEKDVDERNLKNKTKTTEIKKPQIDAVVIDKDGATTFKMPDAPSQPLNMQAQVKPELMAAEPNPTPIGNVPIAPSEDGAPVDKRLMQRGFSHAYDELLEPASIPLGKTTKKRGTP